MGWDEINLGRGGTGYVTSVEGDLSKTACGLDYCPSFLEMIPEVLEANPDFVVVTGGRNDLSRTTEPAYAAGVAEFFAALRRGLPHVTIMALSPIWDDRPVPAGLQTMRTVIEREVTRVGGRYVNLGDPLLNRPDLVASDNRVLPNDAGHAAIASAFDAAYRSHSPGQPTPTLSPSKRTPVAVFIGDSYVSGAGANDQEHRFGLLIAKAMEWNEVNLGRGGTGYVSTVDGDLSKVACGLDYCPSFLEMIPEALAAHPDVVVVTGGRNDLDDATDPTYAAHVAEFFAELRRALPYVTIIALSPIWDDRPVPAGLLTMRTAIAREVTKVGGTYVDIGDPLFGRPDLVSTDNRVLPSDAGHAAIASAFRAAYSPHSAGPQPPDGRR
jgi:lysophospholipase L1-like esterase